MSRFFFLSSRFRYAFAPNNNFNSYNTHWHLAWVYKRYYASHEHENYDTKKKNEIRNETKQNLKFHSKRSPLFEVTRELVETEIN